MEIYFNQRSPAHMELDSFLWLHIIFPTDQPRQAMELELYRDSIHVLYRYTKSSKDWYHLFRTSEFFA